MLIQPKMSRARSSFAHALIRPAAALGICAGAGLTLAQPAGEPGLIDHAIAIRSIDPSVEDFTDLQPLKELIGDSSMVVLGEPSHQEGPVFLAKSRLIKFLHQEMDFDVLVFESGLINGMFAGEALADPDIPLVEAATSGIFAVWGMSAQCAPTFQYVRDAATTDHPITLAGFDAQSTSEQADQHLLAVIERAYAMAGLEAPGDEALAPIRRVATFRAERPKPEELSDLAASFLALAEQIEADRDKAGDNRKAALELELARRTADDLAWFMRMVRFQLEGTIMTTEVETIRERDRRMGDNLAWLAEEYYQGRKLIVWAATRHMVHKQKEIEYPANPGFYDEMDSAGETVFERLGDDVYTIGFIAGSGELGSVFRDETIPIEAPKEGSIEQLAQMRGMRYNEPFLFIDLNGLPADHAMRQTQTMRPLGYAWQNAIWPDQMDAAFYIETMFKNDRAVLAPDGYELTVGD